MTISTDAHSSEHKALVQALRKAYVFVEFYCLRESLEEWQKTKNEINAALIANGETIVYDGVDYAPYLERIKRNES